MSHAVYIHPSSADYADDLPDQAIRSWPSQPRDVLRTSLRIAGVVSCVSAVAVVFGLARLPDIDLNSAPGQSAYIAQMDAASGANHPDHPLLITLTEPNYNDGSIVHTAPLAAMPVLPTAGTATAVKVNAVTVDGDEMSRLLHGADSDTAQTDARDEGATQAMACNEPCAAQEEDDRDQRQPRTQPRAMVYVDGVPAEAPVSDPGDAQP